MVESQLPRGRLARDEQRVVEAGVAPADLGPVLLAAVLRVVHQQVGVPAPVDVVVGPERLDLRRRPLLRLHLCHLLAQLIGVAPGLLVGGEDEGPPVLLQPVAEGCDRVVHRVARDLHAVGVE